MPFGTIRVIYPARRQPEAKQAAQAPAPVFSAGTEQVHILVVARSTVEAADFLCGMYFNMTRMTASSSISVYTRDFQTITQLTDRKQALEDAISSPPGTEVRFGPQDGGQLTGGVLTIGQTGNQALTLDLHFRCAAPGASADGADAVFALLKPGEASNEAVISSARSAGQTFYIMSGLEEQAVFSANDTVPALKAEARAQLEKEFNIPRGHGGYFAYAQVYGGLICDRFENGALICRSNSRCREYAPVGCHLPAFTAILEVMRRREEAGEQMPAYELYTMIRDCFHDREPARLSWCGPGGEVGQG